MPILWLFPKSKATNHNTMEEHWEWQNCGVLSRLLCMGTYFKPARQRFVIDATLFNCNLYLSAASTTNCTVCWIRDWHLGARSGRHGELRDVLEARPGHRSTGSNLQTRRCSRLHRENDGSEPAGAHWASASPQDAAFGVERISDKNNFHAGFWC
jgi:hypothetical protein